ncbi:MAG: site-2 protease family protein [Patescibacteria group bacterium]|nr:site-2 protease family protein [Patescibacteria group bacterium]
MPGPILTFIIFILVLGVIVIFHEIGHFFAARRLGIKVEEFGIGFPPKIVGFKKKGTIYSINWIPIGGFVKIKGEDGGHSADKDSFISKSIAKRATVLSAGVIMNVVLAIILLSIGFGIGLPTLIDENIKNSNVRDQKVQIIDIEKGTPASETDLAVNDQIVKIDETTINSIEDVRSYNTDKIGQTVRVTVNRINKEMEFTVAVKDLDSTGAGKLGVNLVQVGIVSYPWYDAIWRGFLTTFQLLWAIILAFVSLIKGLFVGQPIGDSLTGPIGIAVLTGQVAQLGFIYLLQFTALLSLNLAIINFAPFPALDGGRVLFLLIEKARKKRIPQKTEALIHNLGFTLLMLLIIFITFRDVRKFSGAITGFFKNIFS